ncbi:unnamed protein product [Dicrocoelium dendriticum]|nr:unnamed protein product [Dicrocoelium dendriticum]
MVDLLTNSNDRLKVILDFLQWSTEALTKSHPMNQCRFNKDHWIPVERTEDHEKYCSLRSLGYTKDEISSMPATVSCVGVDERSNSSTSPLITWDLDLDAFSTSKQKKMRILKYRVEQDSTNIETLAIVRDLKRRRQSYRGIHTARRSYTEILREIIKQQTELLQAAHEKQREERLATEKSNRGPCVDRANMDSASCEWRPSASHQHHHRSNRNHLSSSQSPSSRSHPHDSFHHRTLDHRDRDRSHDARKSNDSKKHHKHHKLERKRRSRS